jgi:NAD+ synthase
MSTDAASGRSLLHIDAKAETERIVASIREIVFNKLRRKGAVIGVSGGIDSSVVAYLCARALGNERVQILFTPEGESSPDNIRLGRMVADSLNARWAVEDISQILSGARCYERRDDAVRLVVPEYTKNHKFKIVLPGMDEASRYSIFSIVVQSPEGETRKVRLSPDAYLGIVAATNFKQRARKMVEYYYADLLQYAVAGTPNRLEFELGFFVKNGDGAADFKPISHLYKSQVYQLAAYLGVSEEIQERKPSTDTYPMDQSQEEFYFTLPLQKMDMCLYGKNSNMSAADLAAVSGMEQRQVEQAYRVIDSGRKAAQYLLSPPLHME